MKLQGNLHCCDNSGVKKVKLIKIFKSVSKKRFLILGDIIKVVIMQSSSKSNLVKKGSVLKSIVLNLRKNIRRFDSSYVRCTYSSVVLLNSKNDCVGSRVFAPIPLEMRKKKFLKFVFLSNRII